MTARGIGAGCIIALALALVGLAQTHSQETARGTVARAVDGDTLELESGERIRLKGVDTPETVDPRKPVECFGTRASRFVAGYTTGHRVAIHRLEQDRYGRTVAYVTVQPQARDLGAVLLAHGLARLYVYAGKPFAKLAVYSRLEAEARVNKRGLWGAC